MREGTMATLRAVAGLPHRHPFAIAGVCLGILVAIVLGAGINNVQERIDVVHTETTKLVQAANVCTQKSLSSPRLSRECADRLRTALLNCRRYPGCRQALLAVYGAPVRPQSQPVGAQGEQVNTAASPNEVHKGGGSRSPGHSHPGQKPGGAKPPPPAPSSPPEPETPEQPGHSGKGRSGENGVDACVELAVSACVKVTP